MYGGWLSRLNAVSHENYVYGVWKRKRLLLTSSNNLLITTLWIIIFSVSILRCLHIVPTKKKFF